MGANQFRLSDYFPLRFFLLYSGVAFVYMAGIMLSVRCIVLKRWSFIFGPALRYAGDQLLVKRTHIRTPQPRALARCVDKLEKHGGSSEFTLLVMTHRDREVRSMAGYARASLKP